MAALADLSENERYLLAILQDQSGIDIAEFCWVDSTSQDNIFRCYDYQYPWYRTRAKFQIDQCFAAGTLVLTRTGYVPIEDVAVGDEVWTHRSRWRKVTYTWDRGEREVVRARGFGHHGLIVTPDHKFWTQEGTFAPLSEGARWGLLTDVQTDGEIPSMRPAYASGRQNFVRDVTTPDFLWLYGLYLAEGSLSSSYGTGGQVNRVTFSVHEGEVEYVQSVLGACGLRFNTNQVADEACFNIVVNSQPLAEWMLANGGKRATGKRLAMWVMGLEGKDRQSVLDGYLYGDGWRGTGKQGEERLSFTTVSKELAYGIKMLAASLGWHGSTGLRQRAAVQIDGRDVTGRAAYVTDLRRDRARQGLPIEDGFAWGLVRSLEPAGIARVYDLEVEEDHSFTVEGIAASNCARAIGKSLGIQMRAFAFPFTNPGEEMLITAPELIHLDPVTKYIESRITDCRIGREFLKTAGKATGFTHRPFEATFRNGASIKGRIPQKDGKGVKGSVCYTDTMILTARGLVAAEDLTTDDYVLTHLGRFRRVLHIYRYETENAVEVAGAGHRGIIVSDNHRFYARRNSNPQRTRNLGQPTWLVADPDDPEITKRWYWGSPTEFPMKSELPDFPTPSHMVDFIDEKGVARRRREEVPLAPENYSLLMDLAGRYVADGYVAGGSDSNTRVAFVDDEAGISQIEFTASLLGYGPKRHKHDNAVSVAIYNSELTTWLDEHFGHLAAGKSVPVWLLGADRVLRQAFLDGYLNGDGHWNEAKGRWEISTASKALAIGIKLLAQSLGYGTSFSWVDPQVTEIQGVTLKNAPQRSFRVQLTPGGSRSTLVEDGVLWSKIRKVTPVGRREVIDLVVDEDFSYVADGIIHKGSRFLPGDDRTY